MIATLFEALREFVLLVLFFDLSFVFQDNPKRGSKLFAIVGRPLSTSVSHSSKLLHMNMSSHTIYCVPVLQNGNI